ncbi:Zn-dependent hydrolase [Luteolibacter luteus]|uniref:Zn-dependent hydrolase n=1 Tax=Luteolibacter luteus TaxID=2728835 RepID=A0A858RI22_9BACT|nr:Zn-dependent hydrolase [Luteolibacter luteus]QJE96069.1 Zn-dependent hydrolase [Luteolibacter luteus]
MDEKLEDALDRLLERIEELGELTDTPGDGLSRGFLSPANLEAARRVGEWMRAAGMEVGFDRGGTVRGVMRERQGEFARVQGSVFSERQEEEGEEEGDGRALVLGSHLDTVIDAGKYDGPLGVLIAIAALEVTGALSFPVHVLGFSDEEGVRFHATYLGSRACVGELTEGVLNLRDAKGVSVREALEKGRVPSDQSAVISERQERGRDGSEAGSAVSLASSSFHYAPGDALGYVEVHIEQGRVLEVWREPVCVVSGISGQSRLLITLNGQADHAGTTPMEIRKDALAGAAECILATERIAREQPNLLATVGKLEVKPGASNAIPGEVSFTLDFRHPADGERERLLAELLGSYAGIAEERQLELVSEVVQETGAVACDEALTKRLQEAAKPYTGTPLMLTSGAGHDGVMMSKAMPIGMLFVRCRDGLSHHPDEYASPEDIGVALRVLVDFLLGLDEG